MASHDLTFGVFIPQGWKMELASIEDPQAKWAKAVEVARARRGARPRLALGLRPLPQRAGAGARDDVRVLDDDGGDQPAHQPRSSSARWSAARRTATPALLAKITSNIDVISGGRLIWGIGAGWYEHEFKGYGYEFPKASDRIRVLRETVEIVKAMWTEPDVSYDGTALPARRRAVRPEAAAAAAPADPHRRRRRAAHAAGRRPPRRRVELRRQAPRVGSTRPRCSSSTARTSAATTTRSSKTISPRGLHPRDRGGGRRRRQPLVLGRAGRVVDARATSSGTPEQVAEKIQTYVDLGCTGFYPWCSDYPDTETLRLFAQVAADLR